MRLVFDTGESRCTHTRHESSSPTEGNPDTFWDVFLQNSNHGWLIEGYGQG
jgi:hypothetical protein